MHLRLRTWWPPICGRAADVRSCALFHCPFDDRRAAHLELTENAAHGDIADGGINVDVEAVALSNVEDAWDREAGGVARKLVLVPDGGA